MSKNRVGEKFYCRVDDLMLNVLTREEAVRIIRDKTAHIVPNTEKVKIDCALGRILSADIISNENIPSFDRTTVDGYAVCASDTFGAGGSSPVQLEIVGEILMGENANFTLKNGQCAKISTGGMLPKGANASVMVEHTDSEDELCLVYKSVAPFENVTKTGDDISIGETVLKKGTVITPKQIGVFSALGIFEIPVFKKPVIAIISTGDEISNEPQSGQIRDINTYLLSSLATTYGFDVYEYGVVKDERKDIECAVKKCLNKADAVLISGGSSAGTRDMTADIIDTFGKVYFHGIAMKPGKPTIFGMVDEKPVFGLPGHPLAAYFVFRLIVTEYLRNIMEMPVDKPKRNGLLSVNIPSNHGREEFLCIRYDENNKIVPVHTKSGLVSVLSEAEGFIVIPRNAEGLFKETNVDVYEL